MIPKKRIAIGGISTECSTYSSLLQKENDFDRLSNKELINLVKFPFKKNNIEIIPIFFIKSLPGGPIDSSFYRKAKMQFVSKLKGVGFLDGVLLLMHGAMFVPDLEDPEGDWIEAVRNIVGENCIISASFDLHGQITDRIIKNIDIFTAFRTAPHIDIKETYFRATKHLVNTINGGPKPKVLWLPIPILVSGEMSSTFSEPCKTIYKKIKKYDKKEGILDSNLLIGYVWADTKRATSASVVTCTNLSRGKKACIEIANLYWNKRHKLTFNMESGDINAALLWLPNKFSILADSGDNPTAGGVGDRADVLEALLRKNINNVLIAGIASPKTYFQLKNISISREFFIGGTLGGGGPSLKLIGEQIYFKNECAVVNTKGITLVITKKRRPFHKLADFDALNLNIKNYKLLVVKSGYLSPELQNLSSPSFMILTNGAVCQDFLSLENIKRKQPIFPFQKKAKLYSSF